MARPQLFILKLEISHGKSLIWFFAEKIEFSKLKCFKTQGSDRHEISMYSSTPPTVGELIDELEKKTRVPKSNIQIIFKGQKLHFNPLAPLQQFGIFSGSRLLMVGEKVSFADYYKFLHSTICACNMVKSWTKMLCY